MADGLWMMWKGTKQHKRREVSALGYVFAFSFQLLAFGSTKWYFKRFLLPNPFFIL